MRQGRPHITKRRRETQPRGGTRERIRFGPSSTQFKTHYIAIILLQTPLCARGVGMGAEKRIDHTRDLGDRLKMIGKGLGRRLRPVKSQIKASIPRSANQQSNGIGLRPAVIEKTRIRLFRAGSRAATYPNITSEWPD